MPWYFTLSMSSKDSFSSGLGVVARRSSEIDLHVREPGEKPHSVVPCCAEGSEGVGWEPAPRFVVLSNVLPFLERLSFERSCRLVQNCSAPETLKPSFLRASDLQVDQLGEGLCKPVCHGLTRIRSCAPSPVRTFKHFDGLQEDRLINLTLRLELLALLVASDAARAGKGGDVVGVAL